MKSKVVAVLMILLVSLFIAGCESLKEIDVNKPIFGGAKEAEEATPVEEEIEAEQPAEETEQPVEEEEIVAESEPETAPEETTTPLPEETEQSETTTMAITPEIAKPLDIVTIKVIPNEEYGYKTTIKIYDSNEEKIKQVYIPGCGSICKKEKSITFKVEYSWKGDYCARVVDVETNKEVGDCFKVE
ncbi:MAG: hypothetical protein KKA79_02685 [Nanoarchaeota archaeon]|nr:hypothetical protein [Nanoarchaeota archaeon]